MGTRSTHNLPDHRRLSETWRGVRENRPETDRPDRDPEQAVLDLATGPFTSVEDAHHRLSALEALFYERADRRGAFLLVYARVTEAVGDAIDAGHFDDAQWTTEYLVTFADLYRQALAAYERGDLKAVPDPWQVAFDTAAAEESLVSQDVVLGINAHVNYDLALALDTVGIDPDREVKYADHRAVNQILRRLVDEVQDNLADRYAPGIATIDESLGRVDEAVGFLTLREGRDSAWRSAVALSSRLSARRRLARWVLRVSATGAAYLLLTPNRHASHDRLLALEQSSE